MAQLPQEPASRVYFDPVEASSPILTPSVVEEPLTEMLERSKVPGGFGLLPFLNPFRDPLPTFGANSYLNMNPFQLFPSNLDEDFFSKKPFFLPGMDHLVGSYLGLLAAGVAASSGSGLTASLVAGISTGMATKGVAKLVERCVRARNDIGAETEKKVQKAVFLAMVSVALIGLGVPHLALGRGKMTPLSAGVNSLFNNTASMLGAAGSILGRVASTFNTCVFISSVTYLAVSNPLALSLAITSINFSELMPGGLLNK